MTLNKNNNLTGQHFKYLPYVLTEQGIMMLSGLLKSDIAVKVNIQIIDAFVKMRRYFSNSLINNEKNMAGFHLRYSEHSVRPVIELNKSADITKLNS